MVHYWKRLPQEVHLDNGKVSWFEECCWTILLKAKEEYEYIPASEYYKDGYNLYLRMKEYMSNHLLFLHDYRVPTTSNEAERLLRPCKRKRRRTVTFRNFEFVEYLCQCVSMLIHIRKKESTNLYDRVSRIFG